MINMQLKNVLRQLLLITALILPLSINAAITTYKGKFVGDGSGLTNNAINPNTTNLILSTSNVLANLSGGFIIPIPSNSTTAQIQSIFNNSTNGGLISFQPGNYFIDSNIKITNGNLTISGYGARFIVTNTVVSFAFDTGTNFGKPLNILGAWFDGGTYVDFNDSSRLHVENLVTTDPYYSPFYTNRSGLRVESSGGILIRDCKFTGWSGNALFGIQKGGSFQAQTMSKLRIEDNTFYTNFIAICIPTAQQDWPGYYNAPIGEWNDNDNAEYCQIVHNNAWDNTFAIAASAGNAKVWENQIANNYVSLAMWNGNNSQHGNYSLNDCNHSIYGIIEEGSATGSLIFGNSFLATGIILVENVQGIDFIMNKVASVSLIFTNNCTGQLRGNFYDYHAKWGIDVVTNFSNSPNLLVYNNISDDATNTDGTFSSQIAKYNFGVSTTNLPPSNVTIGSTIPDKWAAQYDYNGNFLGYSPIWINH